MPFVKKLSTQVSSSIKKRWTLCLTLSEKISNQTLMGISIQHWPNSPWILEINLSAPSPSPTPPTKMASLFSKILLILLSVPHSPHTFLFHRLPPISNRYYIFLRASFLHLGLSFHKSFLPRPLVRPLPQNHLATATHALSSPLSSALPKKPTP